MFDGQWVHPVGRSGQAVGCQGQPVQGLGHRVVHLPGEPGALALHGLADREPGPGLGEGLARRPEAEEQIAQGDADSSGDEAEAGEKDRRGVGGLQLRVGVVHAEDDDHLKRGEDRRAAPAVDEPGQQRGAHGDVREGGLGAGRDQQQGTEEGVYAEQPGVTQQDRAKALPVTEQDVRTHERDEDGRADQP